MTNELHDPELITWLLDADPIDVSALRAVAASDAATALREDIRRDVVLPVARRRRGRRIAIVAIAGVAATVVAGVITLLAPSPAANSAYAAPAIHFARQSPRLLLADSGWTVTDLNQEYADQGEMTFASAGRTLDMEWNSPAASFFGPITGRAGQIVTGSPLMVDGHHALAGAVPGQADTGPRYFAALWTVGHLGIEVRGKFANLVEFEAVVRTLHRVSVFTLLAALPPSVVTSTGRKATVAKMLADIPQPKGFSSSKLTDSSLLLDRYQLGAKVTSAVSCSWLGQWLHGNHAERLRASAAMATSRHWAILREMAPEGGWSQAIWEAADNMNGVPMRGLAPGESEASILKNHLC
jgi:hypothetical protein